MKNYLKTSIIYQVFVRNYTEEGTFKALEKKLENIKNLNVDFLYLLPINEIGVEGRKGSLGSPYSIKDYYTINKEYGTIDDFKSLINKTHELGMKIMMDIVFNHTSRDSWIKNNHPEWMYKDENGNFANKAGNWSDVYDLDFNAPGLIDYLVDVIDYYSSLGVDGYRFDVCNLIPATFYKKLKVMLDKKYPETVLLGEAVDANFGIEVRARGFNCLSDAELYDVGFDLLYCYSNWSHLKRYLLNGKLSDLISYKSALNLEEIEFQATGLKIRGLENHDQKRIISYTKNPLYIKNLCAFPVFMKGPMFIYGGLETNSDHAPSLFEKDLIDLSVDLDWFSFIAKLISFKKEDKNKELLVSKTLLTKGKNIVIKNFYSNKDVAYGIFSFNGLVSKIKHNEIEDGLYYDYLTNNEVEVKNHTVVTAYPLYLIKK